MRTYQVSDSQRFCLTMCPIKTKKGDEDGVPKNINLVYLLVFSSFTDTHACLLLTLTEDDR